MSEPPAARSLFQIAIAYADWALGGPAPQVHVGQHSPLCVPNRARGDMPVLLEASTHAANIAYLTYGDRLFYLEGDVVTVGREPNAMIRIDDSFAEWDTVSPQHARLARYGERWMLLDGYCDDQPSENGIYVNRKRTRENYLNDQWLIGFGLVEFRFHVNHAQPPTAVHPTSPESIPCARCGKLNRVQGRFCRQCGGCL